jgi:hypothetical protein
VDTLECSELRTGQYRVHFGPPFIVKQFAPPFIMKSIPICQGKTAETESNLFQLSGFYPGECRQRKQCISGITVKLLETKTEAAEVGVVSQVNGMMF